MYDELVCAFDLGRVTGDVTISYQDGSVYKGPYVEEADVLEAWVRDHAERLAAARRRAEQLAAAGDGGSGGGGGAGAAAGGGKSKGKGKGLKSILKLGGAAAAAGGKGKGVNSKGKGKSGTTASGGRGDGNEGEATGPSEVDVILAEVPPNRKGTHHYGVRKQPSGVVWDGLAVDNHFDAAAVTGNCRVRYISGEW